MMSKLWDKGISVDKLIEDFTVGQDRELDLYLAKYDVLGSLAHTQMLNKIDLLEDAELKEVQRELKQIYKEIENGEFVIEDGIEDVHSQVEMMLIQRLGEAGKKIHSGRSRNDQVLVDLKLYIRSELKDLAGQVREFFTLLIKQSEAHKEVLMPGYTHLQVAMPSSFGLWFGAYAESLADDLHLVQAAYRVANQNPLGSAAGYGSSFPLDRSMTTQLLGFDAMNYNVVYAQMGRGKTEKVVSYALSSVAATLSKMAYDVCLYMSQNFGFVSLPDELTTGSSIMPHKKNPDVFELIRSHCNRIQGIPGQITMMINNLPSGYFRDLQIIKEVFIPAFEELKSCLSIAQYAIENIEVKDSILEDDRYKYVFSVEEVNKLVLEGVPFRDAYRQVGEKIMNNDFDPERTVAHSHEGSIGQLCNEGIVEKFDEIFDAFNFDKVEQAIANLLR
ncbi:argininosuccinate lyase [Puteibacter caeruleilacunae]|nr:argininosuccinate lyase [Puteibacter caeruleilacunae]